MDMTGLMQNTIGYLFRSYSEKLNTSIKISGWVHRVRAGKKGMIIFIDLFDGTDSRVLNCVARKDTYGEEQPTHSLDYDGVSRLRDGEGIELVGDVVESPPNCTQSFEIKVNSVKLIGSVEENYPIQKSNHTNLPILRQIPFFRPRTQITSTLFRMRSSLIDGIRGFFKHQSIPQVDPNILTSSDCEGAGGSLPNIAQYIWAK